MKRDKVALSDKQVNLLEGQARAFIFASHRRHNRIQIPVPLINAGDMDFAKRIVHGERMKLEDIREDGLSLRLVARDVNPEKAGSGAHGLAPLVIGQIRPDSPAFIDMQRSDAQARFTRPTT